MSRKNEIKKLAKDFNKFTISRGVPMSTISRKIGDNSSTNVIDNNLDGYVIDIYTKLLEERIIFLNTEVDSESVELVKCQLLYLEQLDKTDDINLYINSPGGSIYDGLGLLDTMDYVTPDIITVNTGLAASMAAVILAYGANGKRKSLKRARTMIHQPISYGYGGQQASDVEIDAKETLFLKKELIDILSEKTGQSTKKVEKDCDRDYWMSAIEAKDYGLIDEIIKPRFK